MPYKTVKVDVDVILSEFDDETLLQELDSRGVIHQSEVLYKLYRNYLTLTKEQFDKELKKFFRETLNVIEY